MKDKNVTICGAGLVGSLLGIYLGKQGYEVNIYERRPDMRRQSLDGGRSINLALSNRGWKALEGVGVGVEIRKMAIPMYRRVMHAVDGNLTYQPYGREGEAIYSVSRGGLNAQLMDLAEGSGNVKIHFNQRCTAVDHKSSTLEFKDSESSEKQKVKSDLIFGADGAFSAVRSSLQKTDRFIYSQEYIEHGYKELSIPATSEGKHRMEREALHIWPRGNFMLIALPNPDGSFTCTLFFPFEGEPSFTSLTTLGEAREFFSHTFPDALELMTDFDREWEENPTSSLVIIRCFPWVKNRVTLIGDASHAIVPFYGQGMNSGFEDCTILNQLMEQENDWDKILEGFQKERKPNADAIADLAMRNFVEMRDLTGDPEFLLQKKIEKRFSERHPDKWTPLYSLVTFSHIPYAEAKKRGEVQDAIMNKIMALPDIHSRWDSDEVEQEILRNLQSTPNTSNR